MTRRRFTLVACCALAAALGLAAHRSPAALGTLPSEAASLRQVPPLVLPRAMAVSSDACEFTFASGVLEAANMYFPQEMPVYEAVRSEPTLETACALSELLGEPVPNDMRASAPERFPTGSFYILQVGDLYMSCFLHGNDSVTWSNRKPFLRTPTREMDPAVGIDETAAAAHAFLEHTGLLPEGAHLTRVVSTRIAGRGQVVLVRSAVYRRFHNGFPEGIFAVGVNCDGDVCSIKRNMRDLREVGVYPILSPDEAREALSSDAARIEGLSRPGVFAEATIESVEMEYYDGAAGWDMDTIQPIYCFKGTASDPSRGIVREVKATVPAVRPEFVAPLEMARPGGQARGAASRNTPGH